MKRKWIPAALMGCLVVGFAVGALGRPHRVEVQVAPPYQPIPAPASDVAPLPPVDPPAGELPSVPIPTPAIQPPSPPIADLPRSDGLGEYPAWNGVDLNCPDVGHPVRIIDGYDPHDLDRDGDGIGCDGE